MENAQKKEPVGERQNEVVNQILRFMESQDKNYEKMFAENREFVRAINDAKIKKLEREDFKPDIYEETMTRLVKLI
jgi:hypothetical protein